MKYLVICEGGNVRSVALAQLIKESGHEAIAIGMKYVSLETLDLLRDWADEEIDIRIWLPEDKWHNPRSVYLKEEVKKIWSELKNDTRKVST